MRVSQGDGVQEKRGCRYVDRSARAGVLVVPHCGGTRESIPVSGEYADNGHFGDVGRAPTRFPAGRRSRAVDVRLRSSAFRELLVGVVLLHRLQDLPDALESRGECDEIAASKLLRLPAFRRDHEPPLQYVADLGLGIFPWELRYLLAPHRPIVNAQYLQFGGGWLVLAEDLEVRHFKGSVTMGKPPLRDPQAASRDA